MKGSGRVGRGPRLPWQLPLAGGQPDPDKLLWEQAHGAPSPAGPASAPIRPALRLAPGVPAGLMVTHQGLHEGN